MMLATASAKVTGLPAAPAVNLAKFGNHKFFVAIEFLPANQGYARERGWASPASTLKITVARRAKKRAVDLSVAKRDGEPNVLAEKGGSRTLREPYGSQTGFEDQRHHRAPSFSLS